VTLTFGVRGVLAADLEPPRLDGDATALHRFDTVTRPFRAAVRPRPLASSARPLDPEPRTRTEA
jgi:hypothetical protein